MVLTIPFPRMVGMHDYYLRRCNANIYIHPYFENPRTDLLRLPEMDYW